MKTPIVLACCLLLTATAARHSFAQQTPDQRVEALMKLVNTAKQSQQIPERIEITKRIIDGCAKMDDQEDPWNHHPSRFTLLLFAAKVDIGVGNTRAIETLKRLVLEAPNGNLDRISARAFLLKFGVTADASFEEHADLLAVSSALKDNVPEQSIVKRDCQFVVIESISNYCKSMATEIELDELQAKLSDVEKLMIQKKIPFGIIKLIHLGEAYYLLAKSDHDRLGDALSELRTVILSDSVAIPCRAMYWNLTSQHEIARRHFANAFDACAEFERIARLDPPGSYSQVIARDEFARVALYLGDYAAADNALNKNTNAHDLNLGRFPKSERANRFNNAISWRIKSAKAKEGINDFDGARVLLREASEALTESIRKNNPSLACEVDNNLGLNHYLKGEFDDAEKLMANARKSIDALPPDDDRVGEASVNAGWLAVARLDLHAAAEHFRAAADFFKINRSTKHPRYSEALTYQSRVAALQKKTQQARVWIDQAEQLEYERICEDLNASDSLRDRLAMVQEARVHPESVAWPGTVDTYFELAPDLKIPDAEQYDVALRWKGLIARFSAFAKSGGAKSLVDERTIRDKLREAYFREVDFFGEEEKMQEIQGYEDDLRKIQRERRRNRGISAAALELTVKDVIDSLGSDDLFVDIFQVRRFRPPTRGQRIGADSEYLAFTIRSDGTVNRVSLGPVTEVNDAIQAWVGEIQKRPRIATENLPEHNQRLMSRATQVAEFLQKPIIHRQSKYDHLIFRPDGLTHLVPWGALPGTDGKRYWIENAVVEVSDSAGRSHLPVRNPNPSMLVVGNVDFGPMKDDYPELPGSAVEKERIAKSFGDKFPCGTIEQLAQEKADEAAVIKAMPTRDFIHLATHGFYVEADEADEFGVSGATTLLKTGVILAEPQDSASVRDQRLTADEISELDLQSVRLVMLSACQSGLGQSTAGQGVQGMLGSFHSAGAQQVVGSLWKVSDSATVTLVDRFYHYLWNKDLDAAEALTRAQRELIRTPKGDADAELLTHPYAWAAFMCSVR